MKLVSQLLRGGRTDALLKKSRSLFERIAYNVHELTFPEVKAGARPTAVGAEEVGPHIKSVATSKLLWLDIEKPTAKDTEYLARRYPFNAFDLEDCLSRIERPKLDKYEEYLFLLLHFPAFDGEARVSTITQVAIFVGRDYLISLHSGDLKPLANLFQECQTSERAHEENLGHTSGYLLYRILDRLVDSFFLTLDKIIASMERVEERIFSHDPRGTVQDLALLRRDIISLRRIVRPQIPLVDSLERMELLFAEGEELEVQFGDIGDHLRKVWDGLEEYSQVVEVLTDTNDSLISFRTSQVMRVLTIIATIMLPLTLVASIYGMNFDWLPLSDSDWGFPLILGLMFLISGGMLYLFRRQRWL